MDLREQNKVDPLKRNVEKNLEEQEYSPMDPPDAYKPPKMDAVAYEKQHPFVQKLMDDHISFKKELDSFEETLLGIQEKGMSQEAEKKLSHFFHFFDHEFTDHNRSEDRSFFPLLHKRLLEEGEHSQGVAVKTTVIDIMEDDHIKAMQMAAIAFNFLGLAARLPDERSRIIVLDAALEQGKALVELVRLHIFREDNIVFTQAHKYIKPQEFETMTAEGKSS